MLQFEGQEWVGTDWLVRYFSRVVGLFGLGGTLYGYIQVSNPDSPIDVVEYGACPCIYRSLESAKQAASESIMGLRRN